MTQNEQVAVFLAVIKAGLQEKGFGDIAVRRAYQPRRGATPDKLVSFFPVSSKLYGFFGKTQKVGTVIEEKTEQVVETIWQFQAQFKETANSELTATDILLIVSDILRDGREEMRAQGVNMLRITDIRNPYFLDSSDEYTASPSFDIILQTNRQTTKEIPEAHPVCAIYRV